MQRKTSFPDLSSHFLKLGKTCSTKLARGTDGNLLAGNRLEQRKLTRTSGPGECTSGSTELAPATQVARSPSQQRIICLVCKLHKEASDCCEFLHVLVVWSGNTRVPLVAIF